MSFVQLSGMEPPPVRGLRLFECDDPTCKGLKLLGSGHGARCVGTERHPHAPSPMEAIRGEGQEETPGLRLYEAGMESDW